MGVIIDHDLNSPGDLFVVQHWTVNSSVKLTVHISVHRNSPAVKAIISDRIYVRPGGYLHVTHDIVDVQFECEDKVLWGQLIGCCPVRLRRVTSIEAVEVQCCTSFSVAVP